MATTFVSTATAYSTTVAMPTHQAGDLIVMISAVATAGAGAPAGWTVIDADRLADYYWTVSYKFAASSSETSGTWTGAAVLMAYVYRQDVPGSLPTATALVGTASATALFADLAGHSAYARWNYHGGGTSSATMTGWTRRDNFLLDALAATGTANTVGGNSLTATSSGKYVTWTIGLSAVAGNPGAFFQFF